MLTLAPPTSASSLLNYGPATPYIARNMTFLDDPFGCKYKQSWHIDFPKSVKLAQAVPLPFSPCCVLTTERRTLVLLIFPPWVSSSISSLKIPFILGVFYKLGIESRGSTRNVPQGYFWAGTSLLCWVGSIEALGASLSDAELGSR